jgi:hypothetical protein
MTSGEFFNKGVKALDSPHIGHVVRVPLKLTHRSVNVGDDDDNNNPKEYLIAEADYDSTLGLLIEM